MRSISIVRPRMLGPALYAGLSVATISDAEANDLPILSAHIKTNIALAGTVVDRQGQPVSGATVQVLAFGAGAANAGRSTTTGATGGFELQDLDRRSVLLKITRAGYYTEIIPADLHRPFSEVSSSVGNLTLTAKKTGRVRLMFVGDTMFGRRFTDEDQDGLQEAGDLIRANSRVADAQKVVSYVADALSSADYAVANLECAVSADPGPEHPYKSYTFYSHPDTLAGLNTAGIDGVSLGNNHVFDYMDDGLYDTINAVADHDLDFTGAEMSESAALDTVIRRTISGVPLSLQGFSNLRADGTSLTDYLLIALDPDKPGALYAEADNFDTFFAGEEGRFRVPMIHGGTEYSSYPIDEMREHFVDLVDGGAGLVVAHHTHTMHGIGLVDPGDGPKFVLMSLGNFIFDQSTFVTTQSLIAVADVDQTAYGFDVARLELIPVHVENYVPKLLAGRALERHARQLGHLSSTLPLAPSGSSQPDGLRGAVVFPWRQRVVALRDASQYVSHASDESVSLVVKSGSAGPLAFTRKNATDALVGVKTGAAAKVEVGRDILLYGDFEDVDVDGDWLEGFAWDQSEYRYVQSSQVYTGVGAAVLIRRDDHQNDTEMPVRRTIPIPGGAKLSLRGHVRADTGGTFKVMTQFYDADGDSIGTNERYTHSGGTYGWTQFTASFTAPAGAASMRVSLKQSPPAEGEGRVYVDDLALIQWDPKPVDGKTGLKLPGPNNYSYMRFSEIAAGTTRLAVTMTHEIYAAK
ncbi:CapA family protein [Nannocystis sp. SCPEA4]|uniref:CapA family protein n=1 Tax=Nannocystis sp. SCPEA4 TaxID=2996787 RepID=UPI00226DCF6E|nr:CapA family protein [Nannocystis sp. SCPEA4]MCY1054810.1 CapA family protein [Nannocystis sp. SCPEA4]